MIYKLAARVIQYFFGPPLNLAPPKFNFLLRSPQLFWSEIFRSPPKIRVGGLLPCTDLNKLSAAGLFKYVRPFSEHQALKV